MKINFINYIPKFMHGSLVTLNDNYFNLSNYCDCTMYLKYYERIGHNNIKDIMQLNNLFKYYMILDKYKPLVYNTYMEGINITVAWSFLNLDWAKIKGDTLIVFESLDIYVLNTDNKLDYILSILSKNFKQIYIMANPMNIEILKKYNYKNISVIEYYIKLSKERLDKMKDLDIIDNRTLIRHPILIDKYKDYFLYNNRTEFVNTFKFSRHAFCRMGHGPNKDIFIENIGKLVFEYLYMNKPLDYYTYHRIQDDGLHYYMKLIGLDDREDHLNLTGYSNIIQEKILFNKDDLLLKLIEGI